MAQAPMLATSSATVPAGDDWVVEPKWDGFRTIVEVDQRLAVKVTSRHGRRWERALPELAALGPLIGRPAVLDGETIVLADGRPHFGNLSRRLARAPWAQDEARQPPATFMAFDIPHVDDEDLTGQPWTHRRRALEGLHLEGPAITTMACDDGTALYAATASHGLEGVVAKRRRSRYVCGRRSTSWVKVKHRHSGWFDLTGWRPPTRTHPPGALLLADDTAPAGAAIPALNPVAREALRRLVTCHGQHTLDRAAVALPAGVLVRVEYLERSPTGLLREAVARDLRPALPT